ncbi:MAG TPA: chemotaxis protein CheW [Polyangia bacterium]
MSIAAEHIGMWDGGTEAVSTESGFVELIGFTVGGQRFALRADEVAALMVRPRELPAAEGRPEVAGYTTLGRRLVPVFSLRALLGLPDGEVGHWTVLTRSERPLGVAVPGLEGYLCCPAESLRSDVPPEAPLGAQAVVGRGPGARYVISLAAVLRLVTH